MENSDWLPELILLEEFDGDWDSYLEEVYNCFAIDFVDDKPAFEGVRLGLKKHPLYDGKEVTFWHMISEGSNESERIPDIRRCERIKWPKPIIEYSSDPKVKVWRNKRKNAERICLWFEEEEYIVILADRKEYILPWTAYMVTQSHQKKKLQKEYEEYRKNLSIKG